MPELSCFLPSAIGGTGLKFVLDLCTSTSVVDVREIVFDRIGHKDFYLVQNGHLLEGDGEIGNGSIQVVCRTLGGKGGFGSMLRAIGAQIEKTTNREACRDLSGRRLRDINEEQRLKNWIAQQAARENEAKDRKRMKLEKLLKEPSHNFEDQSYEQERSHLLERVADAFEQGVEAGPSCAPSKSSPPHNDIPKVTNGKPQKRKLENKSCGPKEKKKNNLLWIDDLSCSEEDDSEDSGSDGEERKETKSCGKGEEDTEKQVKEEIGEQKVVLNGNASSDGNQTS